MLETCLTVEHLYRSIECYNLHVALPKPKAMPVSLFVCLFKDELLTSSQILMAIFGMLNFQIERKIQHLLLSQFTLYTGFTRIFGMLISVTGKQLLVKVFRIITDIFCTAENPVCF